MRLLVALVTLLMVMCGAPNTCAETCVTSNDMKPATRMAITSAGQRLFDFVAKGDAASLRHAAIPSLASDFSGIEAAIKDNQSALAGANGTPRPPFLLKADGTSANAPAKFFCGAFGGNNQTSDSAVFYLNGLAPGTYAVVIFDAPSSMGAYTVSLILQQQGSEWEIGGVYVKPAQIGGHDSDWFLARARDFETNGQPRNAWLYSLEARTLVSPLAFMSTAATDKLYEESQRARPADFPVDGKVVDMVAGTATYKLIDLSPQAVSNDLDLVVKYQTADVSNTNQAYQGNIAFIKALLTTYPELRDAFAGVVARAVDPYGHVYGTLLAMKDVPPPCNSLDQVVQIEDAMPTGAGHCAGESDFWFTNTSAQAIDCAIIFHKGGRFDPASAVTFTLSPGEKNGGLGKVSTCGADSGQMQYQCFVHVENAGSNSCTTQIKWQ